MTQQLAAPPTTNATRPTAVIAASTTAIAASDDTRLGTPTITSATPHSAATHPSPALTMLQGRYG